MKSVTLTEFRRRLFQLVDEAIATGEPIVIDRRGARVVVRGEKRPSAAEDARAERWRRYWASPPEIVEDLGLEEIEAAGEAYWNWDQEPELDR